MNKIDFIKNCLDLDDELFECLDEELDLENMLKFVSTFSISNINLIGYGEISNNHIYLEPRLSQKKFENIKVQEMTNNSIWISWE